MDENEIENLTQKLLKIISRHNSNKSNREIKIGRSFPEKGKDMTTYGMLWQDDKKSSHGISIIIKKDKMLVMTRKKHITPSTTNNIPRLIEEILADMPKKTI